jgi:hypothetical protein
MPRVNTYEPTELEALETAHHAVLQEIEYITGPFWIDEDLDHGETEEDEAYRERLLNSAYWIRNRLGVLRKEMGKG